jgi:hypothetical protein
LIRYLTLMMSASRAGDPEHALAFGADDERRAVDAHPR